MTDAPAKIKADAPTTSPSASSRPATVKKNRSKTPSLRKPQELVTLFAGKSPTKFVVHKDFACHHSPVLDAAFNGDFIEGQTQKYSFQDTSEESVRLLVHWMYTQKLDTISLEELRTSAMQAEGKKYTTRQNIQDRALVELWVLGDKLLIPRLQNIILDEILGIRVYTKIIRSAMFNYVYENTTTSSPLRRFFVDECIGCFLPSVHLVANKSRYTKEMLLDMLVRFMDLPERAQRSQISPTTRIASYFVSVDP